MPVTVGKTRRLTSNNLNRLSLAIANFVLPSVTKKKNLIGLDQKGLLEINTLAYNENS